ncbi:MAG TPA: DsrE/DsrF/DrsH-like family protein [Acetobacteraceae bacterium]|nr:DsrE/DsrF/DrsH-like family protein [Acetobacteraceae bacterium]
MSSEPLGILLTSGAHDRAHYAFVLATAAAALGRPVTLFATNAGCRALLADWSDLEDVGRDAVIRRRHVAGLGELRDAARETGVQLLVCEAGMRAEALDASELMVGVEVAGVATFLGATAGGQIISL